MVNKSPKKLYSTADWRIIVKEGVYKRRNWFICSVGTHPCAYVRMTKKEMVYDWEGMPIDVHGGITFSELKPELSMTESTKILDKHPLIGWDYAHGGDLYYKRIEDLENKSLHAYTLNEIKKDVYSVIDQLETLKKNNYRMPEDDTI